jgi:Luciferase
MMRDARGPAAIRSSELITAEVESWQGVSSVAHRFGGLELRLGRRELGHLHGDRIADLPFPRRVRNELITSRGSSG